MAKAGGNKKKSRRNDKKHAFDHRGAQIRAAKSQTNTIFSLAASTNPNPKCLGPFTDRQRILMGGNNLVATCYDSKMDLKDKYPNALLNCDALDTAGSEVHFDVDATNLGKESWLNGAQPFHMIVFNFPHLGGATEMDVVNNQKLLRNFFYSTRKFLHPSRGHVLVSLRNTVFYRRWKIQEQAAASGFQLRRTEVFDASIYSGYEPQRTHPASFRDEPPSTTGAYYYIFALDKSILPVDPRQRALQINDFTDCSTKRKETAKVKGIPTLSKMVCQLCDLAFRDVKKYNGHLNSAKHAKKVKALKRKS